MPKTEEDAFYKEVEAYFEPYKSHQLILDFGKYVDQKNKDVNGSVVYPLMMYALSEADYGVGVNEVQTTVFADGKAFNTFLDELKAFYQDTHADEFFNKYAIEEDVAAYLKGEMDGVASTLQRMQHLKSMA